MVEKIKQAIDNIPKEFYYVKFLSHNNEVLTCFRERVWCYEFYHQMRLLNFIDDKDVCINAEPDKTGNNLFQRPINPDFIIHEQGSNDKNLCVIEVKLNLDNKSGIEKDLENLTEMLKKHHYKQAIFVLINHSKNELANLKLSLSKYDDRIIILCKQSFNSEIENFTLGELKNVNQR